MNVETWKPCPTFNGYEASDLGRIRKADSGRILSSYVSNIGYTCARIGSACLGVHRVVADAFHGPCQPRMEVDHIDADKSNNTPQNLRYVTRAQNMLNAAAAGRFPKRKGLRKSDWCKSQKPMAAQKPRDPNRKRPTLDELAAMRAEGLTIQQIADRTKFSWVWVQRACVALRKVVAA